MDIFGINGTIILVPYRLDYKKYNIIFNKNNYLFVLLNEAKPKGLPS